MASRSRLPESPVRGDTSPRYSDEDEDRSLRYERRKSLVGVVTAPHRLRYLTLLFYALGLAVLLFEPEYGAAGVATSSSFSGVGGVGGVGSYGSGSKSLVEDALDIALVVATTQGGGVEVQRSFAASLASGGGGGYKARMVLVEGSGEDAQASPSTTPPSLTPIGEDGSSYRYRTPACFDEGGIPALSVGYHANSHFTCKVMEGLCAAFSLPRPTSPRFVALVAEDALFRWRAFLPKAPTTSALVYTHGIKDWNFGLPHAYVQAAKPWPLMPYWNSSIVLSRDLAHKLCAMHRTAPLELYGPPEMMLGQLMATLEGLTWVHEEVVKVEPSALGAPMCPSALTVVRMGKENWEACAREDPGSVKAG